MNKIQSPTVFAAALLLAACSPPPTDAEKSVDSDMAAAPKAEVKRYPVPGSDFPIANAVEVPADTTLVFLSGKTPAPAKPDAEKFSAEFWGDTETQTVSALTRIQETLAGMGLGMGDVVKMQAFLVGVPESDGMLDFDGFMAGYTQFFGGQAQPNLPARTTVQVAGLAAPGMLVEIDVIVAKP
ncbi:MAG: RidA family protein [Gammaproteobacteria bacterium]|nr:RidA family protein [Gammaproteobacteria bacterium]